MASIDFRGSDGVLGAYKARGIDTWAVFNKKNLMHSGNDESTLSEYLDLMEQHNSATTYVLKVYRNEAADDITDKTECNGSFSFQLADGRAGYMGGGYMGGGNNNNISARLAAIEKKLTGEGVEKAVTIGSTMLGWFQDADDVVKIIGAAKMMFGKSSPSEMMQVVSALGAVQPKLAGGDELSDLQEQTIERLQRALDKLEKCDSDIILHLEQLAKMAEENPAMYKMALGFLK